jgi:hypothetical protein
MASGDTLGVMWAENNQPGTASFAVIDTRNNHVVLDFNGGTAWDAIFPVFLPRNYAGGGVTLDVSFTGGTATGGSVVFTTAFERVGTAQDIDSDSFATGNSGTLVCPGTTGVFNLISIAHTDGAQMDSLAAGEWGRVKLTRAVADSHDTAGGTVQVRYVQMRET